MLTFRNSRERVEVRVQMCVAPDWKNPAKSPAHAGRLGRFCSDTCRKCVHKRQQSGVTKLSRQRLALFWNRQKQAVNKKTACFLSSRKSRLTQWLSRYAVIGGELSAIFESVSLGTVGKRISKKYVLLLLRAIHISALRAFQPSLNLLNG